MRHRLPSPRVVIAVAPVAIAQIPVGAKKVLATLADAATAAPSRAALPTAHISLSTFAVRNDANEDDPAPIRALNRSSFSTTVLTPSKLATCSSCVCSMSVVVSSAALRTPCRHAPLRFFIAFWRKSSIAPAAIPQQKNQLVQGNGKSWDNGANCAGGQTLSEQRPRTTAKVVFGNLVTNL